MANTVRVIAPMVAYTIGKTVVYATRGQVVKNMSSVDVQRLTAIDFVEPIDVAVDTPKPVDDNASTVAVPRRNGPGASKRAWTAYAAAQGVSVDAELSLSDIIQTLNEKGVATE